MPVNFINLWIGNVHTRKADLWLPADRSWGNLSLSTALVRITMCTSHDVGWVNQKWWALELWEISNSDLVAMLARMQIEEAARQREDRAYAQKKQLQLCYHNDFRLLSAYCLRHCPKPFTCVILFNPIRKVLLLLFYKKRNRGTETFSDSPQFTKLVNNRDNVWD